MIKFIYESIIVDITLGTAKEDSKHYWFYFVDLIILLVYLIYFTVVIKEIAITLLYSSFNFNDDFKILTLYLFKGINIINHELPKVFDNLNKFEKYKFLLQKEMIEKYLYQLNESQIHLINKINDIREKNKLPLLKYNVVCEIPEFVKNEKTELYFL